jgi:adenylate kinase family enzyme
MPGAAVILLIDGPDAVGKTTYTEKLARRLSAPVLHWSAPTHDNWWDEYGKPVQAALDTSPTVICDRGFFGELVWSRVLDRPSIFTSQTFEDCCRWYSQLGAMAIVVVRDEAAIVDELDWRGESDQISQVLAAQREFIRVALALPFIPVVVTTSDLLHLEP